MCLGVGASGGSKAINNMAGKAYATAVDSAKAIFGAASTAFNDVMSAVAPIAKAGPGQMGETAQQASNINAATIDQTAAQYRNAATTVKEQQGAVGGGSVMLPSGANIASEEALAEAGAQQESTGLRENLEANYKLGNENWKFATGALEKAPEMFNPATAATDATAKVGQLALNSQKNIDAAPTWGKIAMGAIGEVAGAASTMIPGVGPIAGAAANLAGNAITGATGAATSANGGGGSDITI